MALQRQTSSYASTANQYNSELTMMRSEPHSVRALLFCLTVALCLFLPLKNVRAQVAPVDLQAQVEAGKRLYREGIGVSGEPLKATGAAQTAFSGKEVACAACHRRSGFGTSEGQYAIRPITGPALFDEQTVVVRSPRIKAQLGTRQRAPYTDALLARAIRGGLDASGQPLNAVMPRYVMSDADVKAVSAYLATLSAQPSPGVNDEEIHFATVIQPGVSPEKRRAMLDIMQTFFKDKDANVRYEEQRRAVGNMRMYRAYRKWVLHVWDLTGPSESWRAQLEANYQKQPVFALVGGLGNSSWRPIHEFSERYEIPSVFPQVSLPALTPNNYYGFYFSRGFTLEAEVLARFFREQGTPAKIIQVFRPDESGLTASAALKLAMPSNVSVQDQPLMGSANEAFWRSIAEKKPDAVVMWLDDKDVQSVQSSGVTTSVPVYLSFEMLGGKLPPAAVKLSTDVRMVYPSDLPPKHEARLLRTKLWLHSKNIALTDESTQINTQFSMTVLSDAVGHIMDSFSRDYFVERIEHVVSQTPTPSMFQNVTLGPGQRFAAKGSSIVQVTEGDKKQQLKSISGWLVP